MAKTQPTETSTMTEEEYLNQRLVDQLNWFDRKSGYNQKRFRKMRTVEIILAALIPFLLSLGDWDVQFGTFKIDIISFFVGAIGVAIVVIGGLLALNKYEQNYVNYRKYAEMLRMEKIRYQTQSTPYKDAARFDNLVANVEGILGSEINEWQAYQLQQQQQANIQQQSPVQPAARPIVASAPAPAPETKAASPTETSLADIPAVETEDDEDTPPDIFA